MDFKGINGRDFHIDKMPKESKKADSLDLNAKNELPVCEKSPVNPSFWQNNVGISFRGFQDEDRTEDFLNLCSKEEKEELKKYFFSEEQAFELANAVQDKRITPKNIIDFINATEDTFNKQKEHIYTYCDKANCALAAFSSPAQVIEASVDKSTGEIGKDAIDFINAHVLKIKGGCGHFEGPKNVGFNSNNGRLCDIYTEMSRVAVYFLNAMKDETGSFNSANAKYIGKIMNLPMGKEGRQSSIEPVFLEYMKNKNGVIKKDAYKLFKKHFKDNKYIRVQNEFFKAYAENEETAKRGYKRLRNLYKEDIKGDINVEPFIKHCGSDDDISNKNYEYLKRVFCIIGGPTTVDDKLFTVFANDSKRDIYFDLLRRGKSHGKAFGYAHYFKGQTKEEGDIEQDKFLGRIIRRAINENVSVPSFYDIIRLCCAGSIDINDNFDEEKFNKALALCDSDTVLHFSKNVENALNLIDGKADVNSLKFSDRAAILHALKNLIETDRAEILGKERINKIILDIDKSFDNNDINLPVESEFKKEFIRSVLGVNNKNGEYSEFESTIKNSIPLLKEMKDGVKLKYTRRDFLSDLSKLCDTEEKLQILSQKTGMSPILNQDGNSKEITGYNGILTLDKLDENDEFEGEIYKLCHKFLYENEAQTGDKKLDFELNKIIKACPEFVNTVGKKQYATHKYSLDVHSLLVLANSIDNPNYLKLNSADKVALKMTAILHDISKQEGVVDKEHQIFSAIDVRSAIKRFFNNEETQDRVYALIKNHHWLEEYQTSKAAEKKIAFDFRRPNDYEIAKIIAKADLMSVSDDFYRNHKGALDEENLKPIDERLNELYSTGAAIFESRIVSKDALKNHTETKAGKEYQVINFHKIGDDEDLASYGFEPNTTKKDVYLLVHMVYGDTVKEELGWAKMLTSPVNNGVLSESLITPKHKRTYQNRKYGVVLSQSNIDVANVNDGNMFSGRKKSYEDLVELVLGDEFKTSRSSFKEGLLNALGIDESMLSENEYADFYRKNIATKTSYSQFAESKTYELGGKTFTGAELVSALKEYQNSLIDESDEEHNEIVGNMPKIKAVIAKEKSLLDVPSDLLSFAYENKLPVILI